MSHNILSKDEISELIERNSPSDCIFELTNDLSDEPTTDEEYERSLLLSGNKGNWIPVPERIQTKHQFEAWVAINDIDRSRIHDGDYINFLDWDWAIAGISRETYEPPKVGQVLIERDFYNTDMLRANQEKIYVFGDNVQRHGKEGQSIIRDEPNALGVATMLNQNTTADSYFSDDVAEHWQFIAHDLETIRVLQLEGKDVVFPVGGLGTGLSRMSELCPALFARMNKTLLDVFSVKNVG